AGPPPHPQSAARPHARTLVEARGNGAQRAPRSLFRSSVPECNKIQLRKRLPTPLSGILEMNQDDRLSDLLVIWEERKRAGQPVSAEELCHDCPDLIPELTRQIHAIGSMNALLGDVDQEPETVDVLDTKANSSASSSFVGRLVMSTQS